MCYVSPSFPFEPWVSAQGPETHEALVPILFAVVNKTVPCHRGPSILKRPGPTKG